MKELVRQLLSPSPKVGWLGKKFVTLLHSQRGISLVEVIIASAILTVIAGFVATTTVVFVAAKNGLFHDVKKYYLAEEGYEVIRFLRDNDWDNVGSLTPGQRYSFTMSTSTLAVTTTVETIESRYERSFRIERVYRSSSGAIVSATTTGATLDPQAKKVVIDVVDERGTTTLQAILTNLF